MVCGERVYYVARPAIYAYWCFLVVLLTVPLSFCRFPAKSFSMANLSRKRAKKIIEDIGLNKGWLPPKTAADSPKLTLQSLKTVREDLGAAIQTYAPIKNKIQITAILI